eukprot:347698-Pleurochrysis_carterae.AAC.1
MDSIARPAKSDDQLASTIKLRIKLLPFGNECGTRGVLQVTQACFVQEVQISMMTVGHTHEDIDAVFKRITTYSRKMGKVRTPGRFIKFLKASIPDAQVFDIIEYTHDWA